MNKKGSEQFISDHGQKVSKMIPLLMLFIFGGYCKKQKKQKNKKSERQPRSQDFTRGRGQTVSYRGYSPNVHVDLHAMCYLKKPSKGGHGHRKTPPPPPPLPSSYALEKEVECGIRSLYKPKDYLRLETMSSYSPLV